MRYVNNDDSASKYVDLYYNLTKSKLTGLKDCINQNGFNFSLDELNEYYVRYKASAFFKEAWFYVTKYHATDVFFKLFIDDEIFNHFTTPDKSTNYLEKDMYLNIVLKRDDAEKIIRNVSVKKIDTNDFLLNDSIFYEGLQGFINDKYILVYGND
jgi:hypothetical protein